MNQPVSAEAAVLAAARELIEDAERMGVVLTIDLEPRHPLAMGSYDMRASTRPARAMQPLPNGSRNSAA